VLCAHAAAVTAPGGAPGAALGAGLGSSLSSGAGPEDSSIYFDAADGNRAHSLNTHVFPDTINQVISFVFLPLKHAVFCTFTLATLFFLCLHIDRTEWRLGFP